LLVDELVIRVQDLAALTFFLLQALCFEELKELNELIDLIVLLFSSVELRSCLALGEIEGESLEYNQSLSFLGLGQDVAYGGRRFYRQVWSDQVDSLGRLRLLAKD